MLKNVNKFLTLKNVKQAAYVAPEQTPQTPVVPEPETVTVNVEVYAGVATQTVSAADVATKLGVEDLAAAIADGSVTYVGLNADGTVYTAEDGSTPASTTLGSCGHWYSTEFNPMVWGTEGLTLFAFLEGDGASYTLGYADANAFVEGETYKLAGKYIYGDAEVVFEVVMTGVAAPEVPDFIAPEADKTITVEVEYSKTNYWQLTAEDEVAILAALGLAEDYDYEGAITDAVTAGDIIINGYNNDGTYHPDYTANGGYWCTAEGTVTAWGTNHAAYTEAFASYNYLGGNVGMNAGAVEVGQTISIPVAYVAGDATYVIAVEIKIIEEKLDTTVYEVVGSKEISLETSFALGYVGGFHEIDASLLTDIASAIGVDGVENLTWVMLKGDNTVSGSDAYGGTDGWYGIDGPESWGTNSIAYMNYNHEDANPPAIWVYGCKTDSAKVGDVVTIRIEFRNADTLKAYRYFVTITVVE